MKRGPDILDLWAIQARGMEAGMQAMAAGWLAWASTMRAAPQLFLTGNTVNLPFANGYTQDIAPATNWGWVGQMATGKPEVETEIVRGVASYGSQIGTILDLALAIAERTEGLEGEALERAERLQADVRRIKARHGIGSGDAA
jgi:hypothetical protein